MEWIIVPNYYSIDIPIGEFCNGVTNVGVLYLSNIVLLCIRAIRVI